MSEPLTTADLKAISERLRAATPGPWRLGTFGSNDRVGIDRYFGRNVVLEGDGVLASCTGDRTDAQCEANGAFIANAPTDISRLLEEVKRLSASTMVEYRVQAGETEGTYKAPAALGQLVQEFHDWFRASGAENNMTARLVVDFVSYAITVQKAGMLTPAEQRDLYKKQLDETSAKLAAIEEVDKEIFASWERQKKEHADELANVRANFETMQRLYREASAERDVSRGHLVRVKNDADRLADEVAVLVRLRVIDSRSPAGDALLDYRDPPSTPRADRLAVADGQVAQLRADLKDANDWRDRLADKIGDLEQQLKAVAR